MKTFISLIVIALCLMPSHGHADPCHKINCDCDAIPGEEFQFVCSMQESQLKRVCINKEPSSNMFCGFHGPNAWPLPIALVIEDVEPTINISDSNKKIASLYWSIRQDANFSSSSMRAGKISRAINITKISKRNMDSLFSYQQAVTKKWALENKNKKKRSAWRSYAEDSYSLAEHWQAYQSRILEKIPLRGSEKTAGAAGDSSGQSSDPHWLDLLQSASQISILAYEQSGHAYASANKFRRAASAWKQAAIVSQSMLPVWGSEPKHARKVMSLKQQTAARLNRASLYWLKSNNEEDAEESARAALEYSANKLLESILTEP